MEQRLDEQAGALCKAASAGDIDGIRALLQAGADPNRSYSPLLIACQNGNAEVAKLLLEAGAKPDNFTNDNKLPIHFAAEAGHRAVVQLLIDHGADPNEADACEDNALAYAALGGQLEMMQFLLDQGVVSCGLTALNKAIQCRDAERKDAVIELVLTHGKFYDDGLSGRFDALREMGGFCQRQLLQKARAQQLLLAVAEEHKRLENRRAELEAERAELAEQRERLESLRKRRRLG